MRGFRRTAARVVVAFTLSWVLLSGPVPVAAQEPAAATVVFLVRHAERANDDPRDPGLTDAGQARAEELARVLGNAGLTAVFSTPYRRTMATAKPAAEKAGLEIETYDPGDAEAMKAFVERLRTTPGRHLVTGHSNTTPALVEALGGDPLAAMPESEYDRLYIVTIAKDGTVSSLLLRYGAPSPN